MKRYELQFESDEMLKEVVAALTKKLGLDILEGSSNSINAATNGPQSNRSKDNYSLRSVKSLGVRL